MFNSNPNKILAMSSKPIFNALLVGINEYQHLRNLNACEKDIIRVENFLNRYVSNERFDINIKKLFNQDATKANIVEAFQTHLIDPQLSSEDILLFYFSGHGAEEDAHEVFYHAEPNRKIQVLTCHDSNGKTSENLIADKELRYLIYKATKPGVEFLIFTDCCHSGDNTRAGESDTYRARLSDHLKKRNWEQFIFSKEYPIEHFQNKLLEDALPQGSHYHFAACGSHESAWEESDTGGIFTTALLDALDKTKGDVSYLRLESLIRSSVNKKFIQSPSIYAVSSPETDRGFNAPENPPLFKTFLGSAIKDKPLKATIYFSSPLQNWILDKGAIYGVTEEWGGEPQKVLVNIEKGTVVEATVKDVYAGYSTVEFAPYADILDTETYEAFIPSLMKRTLPIFLHGESSGIETFKDSFSEKTLDDAGIKLVDSADRPEYGVLTKDESYLITLPNSSQPLTKKITGYKNREIVDTLSKISKWTFVKNLKYKKKSSLVGTVELEIHQDDRKLSVTKDNAININLEKSSRNDDGLPFTELKFKLVKKSSQELYCCVIYLSDLFDIVPIPISGTEKVVKFEKDAEIFLRGGKTTESSLDKYILDFNLPEQTYYLQLIVSPIEFDVELFGQMGVNAPRGNEAFGAPVVYRGNRGIHNIPKEWYTTLYTIKKQNPFFK